MASGRALPHNRDAEASVLGGILLDPKAALIQIVELLRADDFYFPAHQVIYDAILKLEESNRPIDVITLEEQLRAENQLDTSQRRSWSVTAPEALPSWL